MVLVPFLFGISVSLWFVVDSRVVEVRDDVVGVGAVGGEWATRVGDQEAGQEVGGTGSWNCPRSNNTNNCLVSSGDGRRPSWGDHCLVVCFRYLDILQISYSAQLMVERGKGRGHLPSDGRSWADRKRGPGGRDESLQAPTIYGVTLQFREHGLPHPCVLPSGRLRGEGWNHQRLLHLCHYYNNHAV